MPQQLAHLISIEGAWQFHYLPDHLQAVATRAATHATHFGATEWAELAGLWHDLGKYQPAFQRRIQSETGYDPDAHLEGSVGRQPHSTAGALHAINQFGPAGRLLAYVIAGHHAGLPDWAPDSTAGAEGGNGSLQARLANAAPELAESLAGLGHPLPEWLSLPMPAANVPGGSEGLALWVRLLFSCLVDADFLDTETFMNPAQAGHRTHVQPQLAELARALHQYQQQLGSPAAPSPVNQIRAEVLAQCRAAAELPPGLFSLTVPTGGGKTLSSLAFALEHAARWQKRRVIYAIPFTSIIEQTAEVFREVFDQYPDAVLEHHSNLDPARETPQNRLWAENWDAPLVVTTNVQLLESLFAARTSRCRKLHNLVNSVIVLDEAQQLPREFLAPVLHVLDLLTRHYGVTILLCTATQPALGAQLDPFGRILRKGLTDVREIVPDPAALAQRLQRVKVQPLPDWQTTSTWPEIAQHMQAHDCVLAIVNRRADCRTLYELLPPDSGRVHLSALMCGQHRSDAIASIKQRLAARHNGDLQPLRVVATQLVEAGVDLDFPVVLRAMAGLDSIAQAAGRCNREGRLSAPGQVFVFQPEQPAPLGLLRQGADTARALLLSGKVTDPLAPDAFGHYFGQLYAKGENDKHGILQLEQRDAARCEIQFRTVASRFRLIEEEGATVIVPYIPPGVTESPVHQWLATLEKDANAHWARRNLQRYTVSIHDNLLKAMLKAGDVEVHAGLYLARRYDASIGLVLPDTLPHPEQLIA